MAASLVLLDLLGWWRDTRGSWYELHLDTPATSLSVTTTRPDGGSRHTNALIKLDASDGSIIRWGTNFVLGTSRQPDQIEWVRVDGSGRRPFVWERGPRHIAPDVGQVPQPTTQHVQPLQEVQPLQYQEELYLSKALSSLLRHKAVDVGIPIRPDGFCLVSHVLRAKVMLGASVADVERVVRQSDKRRFELRTENGELLVRAAQGHSMRVVRDDQLLRSLRVDDNELPDVCVHGTFKRHLSSILCVGLLAGGTSGSRNHVHFIPHEPGDGRVISGLRDGNQIAIYLDLRAALGDGVPFFVSNNSVILSPGIDGVISSEYVVRVRDLETNMDLDLAAARSSAALAISSGTSSCDSCDFWSYCTASCDSCDAAQLTIVQRLEAVLGRSLSHPERLKYEVYDEGRI